MHLSPGSVTTGFPGGLKSAVSGFYHWMGLEPIVSTKGDQKHWNNRPVISALLSVPEAPMLLTLPSWPNGSMTLYAVCPRLLFTQLV